VSMPAAAQVVARRQRGGGIERGCGGHAPIHQRQAGQRAEAAPIERHEQLVRRAGMAGAEDGGARCPLRDQGIDELFRHGRCVRAIGEARFFGKDAPVEPLEQRSACAADYPRLREVNMRIHEAGKQDGARKGLGERAIRRRGTHGRETPGAVDLDEGIGNQVDAHAGGVGTKCPAAQGRRTIIFDTRLGAVLRYYCLHHGDSSANLNGREQEGAMDVAELSELYQKALKVKDAAVRGSVAQALAEATVVKSSLAAASHSAAPKSTLGDALATRALAEVEQVQNSANQLLAGRAAGAAGAAAAEAVAAAALAAESIAAEALSAETVGAEPLVAEPFVAEPFVAEPVLPRNVKAGRGR